eukprot:IDg23498t1
MHGACGDCRIAQSRECDRGVFFLSLAYRIARSTVSESRGQSPRPIGGMPPFARGLCKLKAPAGAQARTTTFGGPWPFHGCSIMQFDTGTRTPLPSTAGTAAQRDHIHTLRPCMRGADQVDVQIGAVRTCDMIWAEGLGVSDLLSIWQGHVRGRGAPIADRREHVAEVLCLLYSQYQTGFGLDAPPNGRRSARVAYGGRGDRVEEAPRRRGATAPRALPSASCINGGEAANAIGTADLNFWRALSDAPDWPRHRRRAGAKACELFYEKLIVQSMIPAIIPDSTHRSVSGPSPSSVRSHVAHIEKRHALRASARPRCASGTFMCMVQHGCAFRHPKRNVPHSMPRAAQKNRSFSATCSSPPFCLLTVLTVQCLRRLCTVRYGSSFRTLEEIAPIFQRGVRRATCGVRRVYAPGVKKKDAYSTMSFLALGFENCEKDAER